jgi:PAS domain S-box-containing protein
MELTNMQDKLTIRAKIKVLLLEDSAADAELILELLKDSGYVLESKVTASEKEFEPLLFRAEFDVILSDFSLPGFNAFGALNLCNQICPEIPFICVSGSIGEETAIELLKAGAVDYILKDRLERLPFAINRALDDAKEKLARKQAEEALKDSEQSYRILANSGQALIWTSDRDKLCNYFNDVWLNFTGRTMEQELGIGWTEGVHPDDLQFCLNTYIEAFERREKFSMQYRVKRYDGVYRWIRDDGSPRYNIKGDFAGYIGHCLDVTDRKNAEEALIESEEKYRLLLENSGIGVGVYSLDGDIMFFNQKAIENMGGKPEDYIGKNLKDVFGEEAGTVYINRVLSAAKSETSIEYEDFVELSSGKHWFLSNHSRMKNGKGEIIGAQVLAHDITERKLAEEKLKESEEKYRALVENALEGILILDMEGTIIFGNGSLARIFELPDVSVIYGKKVFEFMSPESIIKAEEDFINVIKGIDSYVSQYQCYTFSGKQIWIESIGKKIIFEGNPVDIISLRDITERKKAEDALKDSEQKFRELFENSLMGISEADLEGRLKNVNMAYVKMYGFDSPEQLMNEVPNVGQLYAHPDERQEVLKILGEQGFMEPREIELIKRDGSHFFVLVSAKGIKDNEGKFVSYQASHIDITKRKFAEEALKDKAEQLQRFNDLMVGREIKMVDLKREINKLYKRLGEPEQYAVVKGE